MASKEAARKTIQLWLKERDEDRMIKTFPNLVQQHGLHLLKSFRRESTKHEHAIVHELVQQGKEKVLKFVVENHRFDLNVQRSSDQSTPLHLAQWTKQEGLVTLLLALGADVSIKNVYGETACQTKEAPKTLNALLTGAKTTDDILKLVDQRLDDFGQDSVMYAFQLLGTKMADYDPVSCKFNSSFAARKALQASTPYQRLSKAVVGLACRPTTVMNGSLWSTLLRTLNSFPDEAILSQLLVAMGTGEVGCQGWEANHLAACISALAKLGVDTRLWTPVIEELGSSLQPQVDALHEGDLIKLLWALGQMRLENDPLLVAAAGRALDMQNDPNVRQQLPQMLSLAVWAHIRTSSDDRDILLRLAGAIKLKVPVFDINMNVTLPAWCFAKGDIADEELHSAMFKRASVTMYEGRSRHHEEVSGKEKMMSWAQMFVAYCYCCKKCPAAVDAMSFQFRNDLLGLSNRRSGISADVLSQASGLTDARSLAELDKIIDSLAADPAQFIDSLAADGTLLFEDSIEAQGGTVPSEHVANANAAMSHDLLGKIPVPVAKFVLLEFRRDPEAFHAALLQAPELGACRQALQQNELNVQLPNGTKVFVRPEMYQHARDMADARGLQPRHVLLEVEFEEFVMTAITSLPSKLQVTLKRKDDNIWVFDAKRFCGGYVSTSSEATSEEETTWQVNRTFIEFPMASSLCSATGIRLVKSA